MKPGSDWGVRGTSTHAGGASDAEAGVSSFAYQRLGVTAKKSWFFLGDRMVALGSGIDAPTVTNPVWTTVNQCLLEGPVNYSTGSSTTMLGAARRNLASVDWVHHDGIGYFFPDGSGSTTVVGESRTGNWNTINTSLSTDPVTDDVFAIHLNHRYPVTGGSYAYVVMPVADAATMDASAPDDLVIERNDAVAQAASDSTTGYQAVNFWAAGTVAGITSDKPCSILVKRDADSIKVTLCDPTQALAGDIVITIKEPVATLIQADPRITVENSTGTLQLRFAVSGTMGQSLTASFSRN